jgi:hypothetical protein
MMTGKFPSIASIMKGHDVHKYDGPFAQKFKGNLRLHIRNETPIISVKTLLTLSLESSKFHEDSLFHIVIGDIKRETPNHLESGLHLVKLVRITKPAWLPAIKTGR